MANESNSSNAHSFTDLMTSLALIFILLLVATLNNRGSEEEEGVASVKEEVKKVLDKIRQEENLNFSISEDPTDPLTQIITLDEGNVKFDFNNWILKEPGKTNVSKLFIALAPRLCSKDLIGKLESIIVEGHTDETGNITLKGKLENLSISQNRAFAVMEHAFTSIYQKNLEDLECLRTLATATGRGSTRPKVHVDFPPLDPQHAINRRVEIKVRVRPGLSESRLKGSFNGG